MLRIVNRTPRVYVADGFAAPGECERLLAATADLDALRARGMAIRQGSIGLSFEWPVDGDTLLEDLRRRIAGILRLDNRVGAVLIATAMIYLTDTERGGETHFPAAMPDRLLVRPRAGRLLAWFNHREDGARDEQAVHEALPVGAGSKTTLTTFLYCQLSDAASSPPAEP